MNFGFKLGHIRVSGLIRAWFQDRVLKVDPVWFNLWCHLAGVKVCSCNSNTTHSEQNDIRCTCRNPPFPLRWFQIVGDVIVRINIRGSWPLRHHQLIWVCETIFRVTLLNLWSPQTRTATIRRLEIWPSCDASVTLRGIVILTLRATASDRFTTLNCTPIIGRTVYGDTSCNLCLSLLLFHIVRLVPLSPKFVVCVPRVW